ncbi:MAG TPA: UvrD-helicase domain-containing protein [Solirubrobacteraceae bacterium]|nr:UvrD-helicase domain-containing protein [Solirubrobacteraceae bacterium]
MSQPRTVVELTDEQERAVARRQGSLLLAAGAGSGKTAVLVERFVRAVVEDGVAPARILAITFTERAAGELRERVRARLLELDRREHARQAEGAYVSTFHGFCARLLRSHALSAGIEPSFVILEESFASRLQRSVFAEALSGLLAQEGEPAVDLAAAYGADPLRSLVLGAYAQLRSQGCSRPRLPLPRPAADADERDRRALAACALIDRLLGRFGELYAVRKARRGALDFDDLELLARDLLAGRPGLAEQWSQRFELLMVDEFQDSNQRQLQILAALDRDNLFTVGDELQSIYSFRNADVGLFRERGERLAEAQASLALTRNFRSVPPILEAVKRIFAERMGSRFAPLTPTREPVGEAGPSVELLLSDRRGWERQMLDPAIAGLPEATPWRAAEARLLAARVGELVREQGVRAGEVVVLLRALSDLPLYEAALRAQGLPTAAAVGGFWSQQQVADLVAWLRALANPLDEVALYSALASPLVGFSSDALALLASFARERRTGVWQALRDCAEQLQGLLTAPDGKRLAGFLGLFEAQRAELALHPIADLLAETLALSGYEHWVLRREWGARRLAAVHKLMRLARVFEAQEGRDLRGFLEHVEHVESALGGREPDAIADEELEAVRLMSVHVAKGLEFPVVCVADLGRDLNLRQPDLLVDAGEGRIGLRLIELEQLRAEPSLDYERLAQERRAAQQEEEDRILYVACTRARERLLLSGVASFERWPAPREGAAPIAWIAPALIPDLPSILSAERVPRAPFDVAPAEGLSVRCVLNAAPTETDDDKPAVSPTPTSAPGSSRALTGAGPDDRSEHAAEVSDFASAQRHGERHGVAAEQAAPLLDPDGAVSYSSLAQLERCGYRYYLERVLRMPERHVREQGTPRGELDPRLRGTIVHVLLETVDFAGRTAASEQDVTRAAGRIGVKLTPAQRDEIVALLAAAFAAEPAARLAKSRQARREHPFAFSLERDGASSPEQPLVAGFIDLIVREADGTTLIVDYKSDRLRGGEDLEQVVRRDYAFQRLIYALAAIEDGAGRVEVAHWFLERPQRWISARFSDSEADLLRERLRGELAALRAKGFSVAEEPHRDLCSTCPGRGGLCSWGETHTMRARSTTLAAL